ncbi:hypothetical protein AB0M61_23825 [Streptomyces sp. NPDC051642]|uniref:hypothetical protein n=1 Tax=Streptomyces sp. NPDC051642 TaxID=3154646 RepID=UPI0034279F27
MREVPWSRPLTYDPDSIGHGRQASTPSLTPSGPATPSPALSPLEFPLLDPPPARPEGPLDLRELLDRAHALSAIFDDRSAQEQSLDLTGDHHASADHTLSVHTPMDSPVILPDTPDLRATVTPVEDVAHLPTPPGEKAPYPFPSIPTREHREQPPADTSDRTALQRAAGYLSSTQNGRTTTPTSTSPANSGSSPSRPVPPPSRSASPRVR